jgi:hypothetical protein
MSLQINFQDWFKTIVAIFLLIDAKLFMGFIVGDTDKL